MAALPPLPEHELRPFLHGIQIDPDDDLAIRALGDWLEEMGDVRADLVRAGLIGDLTTVRKWREQYGVDWWGKLPKGVRLEIRRGVVELHWSAVQLTQDQHQLPPELLEMFRQGWVFAVVLEGPLTDTVADWAAELLDYTTILRWDLANDLNLNHLPRLPRLRELDLCKSRHISGAGLTVLRHYRSLWRLYLSGCEAITQALISDLPELRHLRLSWNSQMVGVTLIDLPELRVLSLAMNDVLHELWTTGLPNLRELSLRRCLMLEAQDLAALSSIDSMVSLDLDGCSRLVGSGINHLAGMENLRELTLTNCRSLDRVRVPSLPALRTLDLSHSSLRSIDFGDLPALELLDLRGVHWQARRSATIEQLRQTLPVDCAIRL